ncbi:hypothetical protein [Kordiimonas pumila]|nr:hypothetical protein [Kordiimonas pumila]
MFTMDKVAASIGDFFTKYFEESIMESSETLTYTRYMETMGKQFDQYLVRIKAQNAKGIILPKPLMEKVIEIGQKYTAGPATEDLLYRMFAEKLEAVESLFVAEKKNGISGSGKRGLL